MRWFFVTVFCLTFLGKIEAYDELDTQVELFSEEEGMFALESEIDALLEDEMLADESIRGQQGYGQLDELVGEEEEFFSPSSEVKSPVLPIRNLPKQMNVEQFETQSLGVEVDRLVQAEEEMVITPTSTLDTIQKETAKSVQTIEISLRQVFAGSPIIYSLLFFLSTISVCVWLYSMLTIRSVDFLPPKLIKELRTKLVSNQFDEALDLCVKQKHFFCKMLASGILARRHGLNVMVDTMKAEGKRSTVAFWQRISILNEIAIIAPMLGLLGTVLGMFYAFYDLNRSVESVSLLFDGLGISVGTTVAGLFVAILAMILYSVAKYRLVRILAVVENEAQSFAALIDTRGGN